MTLNIFQLTYKTTKKVHVWKPFIAVKFLLLQFFVSQRRLVETSNVIAHDPILAAWERYGVVLN